jgi:OOP family OmpA-OmpF porin
MRSRNTQILDPKKFFVATDFREEQMIRTLWLLLGALFIAVGCATQEEQKPAEAPKPAPAPAAAPAPAPAPVPRSVEAKPKPVAEKVTFAADVLFDFDRAVITQEGKSKLDDLSSKMRGMNLEVAIGIGHADRIGSAAYNQALSLRRAEAVKAYLISKGTEANRIYTEGKGKNQPVSGERCRKMGEEGRANKKLVACLAVDRRVEIEVIGTRKP